MFALALQLALLGVTAIVVDAQSLKVDNQCDKPVLLYTSYGVDPTPNYVTVDAYGSVNMSVRWGIVVSIGTGCTEDAHYCTTGGPEWNGQTPFNSAELSYFPGFVTYAISNVYGYNAGMQIFSADASCAAIACTMPSGCPVPGPDGSCYSPCCNSSDACGDGALPPGGGGCVNNADQGPYSSFYSEACPNAYAYPNERGGYMQDNQVNFGCSNTDMTLKLCPGTTSNYTQATSRMPS